jgi:flavodoxin
MSKNLVAYFSASGVTAKLAEKLADLTGADICEIKPKKLYSRADLDWTNKQSRSTIEMSDRSIRPELADGLPDISGYDTVLLGFPIWWGVAPTIVNTFLESVNVSGKKIAVFATSGGSGMGNTVAELKHSAKDAVWLPEKLLRSSDESGIKTWIQSLGL